MNTRRKRVSIIAGLLSIVLLAACLWSAQAGGGPAKLSIEQAQRIEALTEARQRWEAQRPQRYRLVVRQESFGTCEQQMLIEDEAVVAIEQDSCDGWPIIAKAGSQNACQPKTTAHGDGAVSAEVDPNCRPPAGAVSDLLAQIEALHQQQECGPNGCTCDGVWVADVTYDQQLGYPQRVHEWVNPDLRPPPPLLERLKGFFGQSNFACTAIGWTDATTEIISLTPLE